MKKDTLEANKTKKQPYVKPTIEVMPSPEEELCLVSVSQQKPPKDGSDQQHDEDETQANALWMKQKSVWDN